MKSYLFALAAALSLSFAAQAKPPTVDPTYGLPLPIVDKAHAAAPDANWIWASATTDNQTVLFRRKFSLNAIPKRAVILITCDDSYAIFVNGRQVDQTEPGKPEATDWANVHSVNIASYLTVGENVIAVRGLNVSGSAGLLARLEVSGGPALVTNETWKALQVSSLPQNWENPSFDDSSWPAAIREAKAGEGIWGQVSELNGWSDFGYTAPYLSHIYLPVAHVSEIHDVAGNILGTANLPGDKNAVITVMPPAKGSYDDASMVVDFGEEIAGRVQITGLTDGTISVGTGESFEETTQSPWKGQNIVNLTPGTASYTRYSAFRYAKLTFVKSDHSGPIRFKVDVDHKYYPVQYKGSFSCSDPLITQLWYTGAYTTHLCMQEDIWDAPKRDRQRWIGDLHVSGEVINDVFADKFLMEQTMQRLRDDANNSHVNGIPGYSCAWICTLADFHRHIGDYDFLKKQHDPLISLLEYMKGDLDDRGLFADKSKAWPFVDWSPGFSDNTPEALAATQFFYIKSAHEAAFLLQEMGDTENAHKYADWGDMLANAARKYLPNPATSTFGDRLQENAMAVYSETSDSVQDDAIYNHVLNLDSSAWDKTGNPPYNNGVISPYYANYVLRALSMTGHTDAGLRFLRSYWGAMLEEGATTFWESYDPNWKKTNFHANLLADGLQGYFVSLCHGWSSAPTSWLTDHVLGVRPTSGGFKTAVIQPDLGDLAWAEGDIPTPNGLIHVRAANNAGHISCYIVLPKGVDAEVITPGEKPVQLSQAGEYTIK